MRTILLFLYVLFFSLGCNFFSPREEFEEPNGNPLVDPFNFDQILDKVGSHFVSANPRELFDVTMIYIDANTNKNKKFGKDVFVDNINLLKSKYDFSVQWSYSSVGDQVKDFDDSLIISDVEYCVEYREKDHDISTTRIECGSSKFVLKGKPAWRIYSWIDAPDKIEGQSFFVPIGSEL